MKNHLKSIVACSAVAVGIGTLWAVEPEAAPAPAPAAATVKTKVINYSLAPGATSQPILIPARIPVSLTGVCLTFDFRGVGSATLLSIPKKFIEWVGLESTSPAAITEGYDDTEGTHIVYLDYEHEVDVQVKDSEQIIIHNASSGQRKGQVVLTYSK